MWIRNSAQAHEIDRRAAAEFGLTAPVLMERAGATVLAALPAETSNLVVLCGKGNNGADGFVVARLAKAAGINVDCLVATTQEELGVEAKAQFEKLVEAGVAPYCYDNPNWATVINALGKAEWVIDALLGTGARGAPTGGTAILIEAANGLGAKILSVDVPSGIESDTGASPGLSIRATKTVTFGFPKPCFFLLNGLIQAGDWSVADIGYPADLLDEPTDAEWINPSWVGRRLPTRSKASHKGANGSVLIVAGSDRMRGAAILSASGALRSGAGLVTVAGVESVCAAVASQLPECMLLPLPEVSDAAAKVVLEQQHRFDAAVFGPGLTHEPPVLDLLREVFGIWSKPCVVDADALNAVSLGVPLPRGPVVMTPHPGEMGRLLCCAISEVEADRFGTLAKAVQKFGKCVLLKGAASLVGAPGQPLAANATGNPGMATGGMGDVLSGVIATLLAQGLSDPEAAACGMAWHGLAADECMAKIGPIGYSARDVVQALPLVRARMTTS